MQQINITKIPVRRNHGLDGELGDVLECVDPTDIPDVLVGQIVPEGPIDSQISVEEIYLVMDGQGEIVAGSGENGVEGRYTKRSLQAVTRFGEVSLDRN